MDTNFTLTVILSCILLLLLIVQLKIKFFKSRKEKMFLKIKGPDYNFLFGNALQFIGPRHDILNKFFGVWKSFPNEPMSRLWFGDQAFLVIQKARAAEVILNSSNFLGKGDLYKFFRPWIGTGLITRSATEWESRRKFINPTFHAQHQDKFQAIFNEQAKIFLTILKKEHVGNGPFDIFPYLGRCSLDIVCETALGKKMNFQSYCNSDYIKAVTKILEIVMMRGMYPWLRPNWLFNLTSYGRFWEKSVNYTHNFAKKVIVEKQKDFLMKSASQPETSDNEETFGQKRKLPFIDLLISNSGPGGILTDDDVLYEVNTLVAAGMDTTAATLCWTLFNIGRFPEIQQKVHEELDYVIGSDSDQPLTDEDLNQMKFLECVIKETMRLFPPVPIILRQITEDTEICGYLVPKDVTACFFIPGIHRDPEFYSDPEKFDPDHFLPENCVNRNPYAYIPFSAGPRNCIGQKYALIALKTIIAYIMKQFHVTSMDKLENLKLYSEIVLYPADGMWLKLESRNKAVD